MPSATTARENLLHYLPQHKVLICKKCRYAIQPSAISRHLKDLHHIYRSERKQLLEYAKALPLADPREVILPSPYEPSIDLLPTESGLACSAEGCAHLCVTVKRMKSHWVTAHRDVVGNVLQWRPVTLQTFFRGNQLRYFVIDSTPLTKSEPCSSTESSPSSPLLGTPLPEDWTPQDVALFKHFRTSTYHTLGRRSESRYLWGNTIVLISIEYEFLKHGILACSALHLAHLQPSSRRHYHMVATMHQDLALPLFRFAIAQTTTENCNAILAFSQLLIVLCYASEATDEDLLFVRGKKDSGLPDWLQIIRGSCAMFSAVWSVMENGILSNIINEGRVTHDEALPIAPENPIHDAQLRGLIHFPWLGNVAIPEGLPVLFVLEGERMQTYTSALIALSRAFVMAEAAKEKGLFSIWTAVQIWPARISMDYLELLKKRDPGALVLLAHYCVLLEPLEEHWFMTGFRKRLLMRIWRQLDVELKKWIEWPMKEAGLDVDVDMVHVP
ncbi:hypothetical protein B0J14DRAFT_605216 [Halenospora varia]|nr:hypothetical protein B0J14DRAFT_605216 [Halenospora varia]